MQNEWKVSVLIVAVFHWIGASYGLTTSELCTYDEVALAARHIKACNQHLGAIGTAILQHRDGMTYHGMCREVSAYIHCMERAYNCPELLMNFIKDINTYTSEPYHCKPNASMPDMTPQYREVEDEQDLRNKEFQESGASVLDRGKLVTVLLLLLAMGYAQLT